MNIFMYSSDYFVILNYYSYLFLVGISYTNYRTSSYDIKGEDNVDSDSSNRDFDRFVVSAICRHVHIFNS